MRFDFLELVEKWSYDYTAGHLEFVQRELERLHRAYPKETLNGISDGPIGNRDCPSVVVSHIAAPPGQGVAELERQFDINLPADFKEFYSLHNEALILTRNPVLIMSPDVMADVSNELRDAHEVPLSLPRHVIRFGWLGTDSYFLLRSKGAGNEWEVMVSSYSHATDQELQERTAWGTSCDDSFTDWLHRMMTTDGVPLHPTYPNDEEDQWSKRVV